MSSSRLTHRAAGAAIGAGVFIGLTLMSAAAAAADPPVPPPCTAAEMARVMSGVSFETSNYLTAHPDVNDFFTSLKGQPKDQIGKQVRTYLEANPAIQQDLERIRQPGADFRQRCGLPATP
ncbi:heme-binding protein [Mycolicibacterium nivoides]|uniref:Heme-binding protein n=1 Tax=Mycolicibacterium nivoides TaxID=2487344 RepID=A0ABW9LFE9_9MYCO|nr:heme-binding protein [Mycolicibacterium nivoides]MBN3513197.1 heme-binding protein [Mycolicibacterium septicum]QRY42546.1 heme-binding protein [Mycolicibacterium boenickei]SER50126.1 hemophore-related protein, Rv0203/Rv1174c family [Mycobacterium sp. 88mf]SFG27009.1 hemophore-related protein, Rv0203/Rv1174c family [Mycobacterium sp. 455mf]